MNEKTFHKTHPYAFVLSLQFTLFIVAILSGAVTKRLGLPTYTLYGIMMTTLTIIIALILWKMNWWQTIGFRKLQKKCMIDYLSFIKSEDIIKNLQSSKPGLEGMISTAIITIVFITYGVFVLRSSTIKENDLEKVDDSYSLHLAY